jgi:hypothetical protein
MRFSRIWFGFWILISGDYLVVFIEFEFERSVELFCAGLRLMGGFSLLVL